MEILTVKTAPTKVLKFAVSRLTSMQQVDCTIFPFKDGTKLPMPQYIIHLYKVDRQ